MRMVHLVKSFVFVDSYFMILWLDLMFMDWTFFFFLWHESWVGCEM